MVTVAFDLSYGRPVLDDHLIHLLAAFGHLYDCVNVGRSRMGMTYPDLCEPLFRLFAPYKHI